MDQIQNEKMVFSFKIENLIYIITVFLIGIAK